MIKLGVNVDHIATIREARGGWEPNPLEAAFISEKAGAHGITVHLREDLRHIQYRDVLAIQENVLLPLNLEMALNHKVMSFALKIKPNSVTIVPEQREELTTEGGLDVVKNFTKIQSFAKKCKKRGIEVSLFIDPVAKQIEASYKTGADAVELHTGDYANELKNKDNEINRLQKSAELALKYKLKVHAGHGLNYSNIFSILKLPGLISVNIGHSIVSRAVMVGMKKAVSDMVSLLK